MTRAAVWKAYQRFLQQASEEIIAVVGEEFGGGILGRTASVGVRKATKGIREEMRTQGEIVVQYATAIAEGDDGHGYEEEFLETNPVYRRYDGDREGELRDDLLAHFRTIGTDLAPLVASPRDDFWEALREEYSREQAERIVSRHFSQAETFTKYRSGVFASEALGKRVIGVIDEGERRLRNDLVSELDRVYDE